MGNQYTITKGHGRRTAWVVQHGEMTHFFRSRAKAEAFVRLMESDRIAQAVSA